MSRRLQQWEASFAPQLRERQHSLCERRAFLGGVAKSAALAATLPAAAVLASTAQADLDAQDGREPWRSFAAVHNMLFPPDESSPGAADINATAYLRFVLEAPDTDREEREFILNGIEWLNGIADEQFGKPFIRLDTGRREQVLQLIARSSAGESWLSYLLYYIFEALLADPVYGANPGQIGWRWLQHQAGFPRPPADKTYIKLL